MMKRTAAVLAVGLTTVFATISIARADVIVLYDAGTNEAEFAQNVMPAVEAPNSSASDLSRAPAVLAFQTQEQVSNPGNIVYASGFYTGGSGDTTRYLQFTVQADPTYGLTLTSLTFIHDTVTNGPTDWFVRSSLDGFTSDLDSGTIPLSGLLPESVPLSITSETGPITFRIYATGASDVVAYRNDDITLNGTVALIPEPFSAALFVLGLAVVIRRARKSNG